MVKASLKATPPVFLQAPTGQGHKQNLLPWEHLSEPAGNLTATHPSAQGQIEQNNVRGKQAGHVEGCRAVVEGPGLGAPQMQEEGQAVGGVWVVVNNQ